MPRGGADYSLRPASKSALSISGHVLLKLLNHADLASDTDERIFWRLVTVRWWVGSGTLDVGIIVGRAGGHVHDLDPKLGAEVKELKRFSQIVLSWIMQIRSKTIEIRQAVGEIFRNAGTQLARLREAGIRPEGNEVESTKAHCQVDSISTGADGLDDVAKDAGSIFEGAAVFSWSDFSAEEFVQQVAVAMLNINKVRSDFRGDSGGSHVVLDQSLDLSIREYLSVAGDAELFIKDRMAVSDARLQS
jgi:hypothetical protein